MKFDDISHEIFLARKDLRISNVLKDTVFKDININQAYSIQKTVIELLGQNIAGWKIGGTNNLSQKIFKTTNQFWGPIFENSLFQNSEYLTLKEGELELAFKFSEKIELLSSNDSINKSNLREYISSIAIAIEYPFSCVRRVNDPNLSALISDCCASGQALVSKEIKYKENYDFGFIDFKINSSLIERCSAKNLMKSCNNIILDFINKSIKKNLALKGGQWLLTGGISPLIHFQKNSLIEISSRDFEIVYCV